MYYIDKCNYEIVIICVAITTRRKNDNLPFIIMTHFPAFPDNNNDFPLFKYIFKAIKIKSE